MSNDSKLGLVIGIGLVVLIAIVYFRRDPVPAGTAAAARAPAPIQSASTGGSPSAPGISSAPLGFTPLTPVASNPPLSPRVQMPAEPETISPVAPPPPSR